MAFANRRSSSNDAKKEEPGKKPDWTVRCRQAPGSDHFMTAGAAWNVQVKGRDAVSVKLTALPVQFDGSLLLMEPLDD